MLRLMRLMRLKLNAGMDFISLTLKEMKFYFEW